MRVKNYKPRSTLCLIEQAGRQVRSSQAAESWGASIREREIDAAVLRWCYASAPSVRSNDCGPAVEQGCDLTDGWVDVSVLGGPQTGTGVGAPSTKISVRTSLDGWTSPSKGEPDGPEVWQCRFPSELQRPGLTVELVVRLRQ